MEWGLTGVMTLVIINLGYFMGVVLGVIGACLMFALSYSRIGVIRRHLTRQEFSSNVERSPEQSRLLREEGKRVHVFWLSGFIFGSSNGLFERIKRVIDAQRDKPVGYVVLDFGAVPGLDTSAVLSLVKLRNYCEEHDVTLGFSGLSDSMRASFERAGFFGGSGAIKSSPAATRPSSGARTCCSCITRWVRPRPQFRVGSNRNSAARSISPASLRSWSTRN